MKRTAQDAGFGDVHEDDKTHTPNAPADGKSFGKKPASNLADNNQGGDSRLPDIPVSYDGRRGAVSSAVDNLTAHMGEKMSLDSENAAGPPPEQVNPPHTPGLGPFLGRLPAELRERIFDFAYADTKIGVKNVPAPVKARSAAEMESSQAYQAEVRAFIRRREEESARDKNKNLSALNRLLVSKQFHKEARPVLLKTGIFVFPTQMATWHYFASRQGRTICPQMRTVQIKQNAWRIVLPLLNRRFTDLRSLILLGLGIEDLELRRPAKILQNGNCEKTLKTLKFAPERDCALITLLAQIPGLKNVEIDLRDCRLCEFKRLQRRMRRDFRGTDQPDCAFKVLAKMVEIRALRFKMKESGKTRMMEEHIAEKERACYALAAEREVKERAQRELDERRERLRESYRKHSRAAQRRQRDDAEG